MSRKIIRYLCLYCGTEFSDRVARPFCRVACSELWKSSHYGQKPVAQAAVVIPPFEPTVILVPEEHQLTTEELARAAVFILTGKIRDVEEAIALVKRTPWPEEKE